MSGENCRQDYHCRDCGDSADLNARVTQLTDTLTDVLGCPVVESEGTNPMVLTMHISLARLQKWRAVLEEVKP